MRDDNFISDNIDKAVSGYDIFYAKFSNGAFSSSADMINNKEGAVIGVVYVNEQDTNRARSSWLQSTIQNTDCDCVSIIMVAFVTWTITHRITSPEGHRLGARGKYNYKIQVRGNDELVYWRQFNSHQPAGRRR